jgi:hypothetical protein
MVQGLPADSWPTSTFLQTEVKDNSASLGVMSGQHISPSAFLDVDYHYKSLATHIPHNAGLASICPAEDQT